MEKSGSQRRETAAVRVFRSSRGSAFFWNCAGGLFCVALMLGLASFALDTLDTLRLVTDGLFWSALLVMLGLCHALSGAQQVSVSSKELEVRLPFRQPLRLVRSEPFVILHHREETQAMSGEALSFGSGKRRLRVSKTGFSAQAWADLLQTVLVWKENAPLSAFAGLGLPDSAPKTVAGISKVFRDSAGEITYEADSTWSPTLILAGWAFCTVVALMLATPPLLDGTWREHMEVSIYLPGFWVALTAFVGYLMTRTVERITFLQNEIVLEPLVGPARRIGYPHIERGSGRFLHTTDGHFLLGTHNAAVCRRILLARRIPSSASRWVSWESAPQSSE